jgi:hypothetical protein
MEIMPKKPGAVPSTAPSDVTENGELERPVPTRRTIDCAGNPEVSERRGVQRGGRRRDDVTV